MEKSEESTGVIGMMDLLIADMDKEMTEGTATEKEAQKDYEQMTADSAAKRGEDFACGMGQSLEGPIGWPFQGPCPYTGSSTVCIYRGPGLQHPSQ